MKWKRIKKTIAVLAACLCCTTLFTGVVYADTDGTELQISSPMKLELQLGSQWAGVEFQLKTDTGIYPGTIVVGEDGVLRTELGGSVNYTLSCINSTVTAPTHEEPAAPATAYPNETDPAPSDETAPNLDDELATEPDTSAKDDKPSEEPTPAIPETEENTVGGIPVKHIILFGAGMLLAVGSLIAISVVKKRKASINARYDDDEDDDY